MDPLINIRAIVNDDLELLDFITAIEEQLDTDVNQLYDAWQINSIPLMKPLTHKLKTTFLSLDCGEFCNAIVHWDNALSHKKDIDTYQPYAQLFFEAIPILKEKLLAEKQRILANNKS